ncbi:hypothetical protein ABVT39_024110, partial [Epinephelus coioides]
EFVATSGLPVTAMQAKKKWNNLKDKYKELRDPPTGKGVEAGSVTAATWLWHSIMVAALQGQHSISRPLVDAANLTATSGGTVSTPASALQPSTSSSGENGEAERPSKMRKRKKTKREVSSKNSRKKEKFNLQKAANVP